MLKQLFYQINILEALETIDKITNERIMSVTDSDIPSFQFSFQYTEMYCKKLKRAYSYWVFQFLYFCEIFVILQIFDVQRF